MNLPLHHSGTHTSSLLLKFLEGINSSGGEALKILKEFDKKKPVSWKTNRKHR